MFIVSRDDDLDSLLYRMHVRNPNIISAEFLRNEDPVTNVGKQFPGIPGQKPPVKICIANCRKTLQIAQQAAYCGTIANHMQLPPEYNVYTGCVSLL